MLPQALSGQVLQRQHLVRRGTGMVEKGHGTKLGWQGETEGRGFELAITKKVSNNDEWSSYQPPLPPNLGRQH